MKKYNVIVVDPPWNLKKIKRKVRSNQVGFDYKTMSIDEIKNLPIKKLANKNSWLFLWATQKYLFKAKDVLEEWGFNHLITMCWKKEYGRSNGMPLYGFRWNAEFVLVGYIEKPEIYPKRKLIKACFSAVNEGHSVKPGLFYDEVGKLGKKRIDLFARNKRDGWDVWGNEVESDIDMKLKAH